MLTNHEDSLRRLYFEYNYFETFERRFDPSPFLFQSNLSTTQIIELRLLKNLSFIWKLETFLLPLISHDGSMRLLSTGDRRMHGHGHNIPSNSWSFLVILRLFEQCVWICKLFSWLGNRIKQKMNQTSSLNSTLKSVVVKKIAMRLWSREQSFQSRWSHSEFDHYSERSSHRRNHTKIFILNQIDLILISRLDRKYK